VEAADVPLATDGMEVEVDTAFYEKRIAALQAAMK
jgi:hypothetical protein